MSKQTFTLRYLSKTAVGVPRDLAKSAIAQFRPIRPTVLIFNCTFVCDARCTMCSNWKRGNRKEDMTLAEIDHVMDDPFWHAVENLNISGGEPTTRNDLPELVELFVKRLPRLRKLGINTTGLTPHRAIPMLTRIVKFCSERDVLISIRVSLDGIGEVHNEVRDVKRGFDKACQTIEAMQALAADTPGFQFGIASTIFATNLTDATNILAWARERKLDVVFNMLRFTDNMLGNRSLEESIGFRPREEEYMRHLLPRPRQGRERALGPGVHVPALRGHDRQRLSAHDAVPVQVAGPAPQLERRAVLLRELEGDRQRPRDAGRRSLLPAENLAHRATFDDTICKTCLSPCQVNVGAMKQVVPYAKFLRRAVKVKRDPARHLETLPSMPAAK